MAGAPIVIVGGGPAGFSVASEYRAAGGREPVTMLCAEPLPPYRRPPLTKEFLRGRTTRDELRMRPADWFIAHGIDVRVGVSAASLHPASRTLVTDAGEEIAFAECVLCTGSEPLRPPVPGASGRGVHVIRTARDSAEVAMAARPGSRVAVVGAGFIGCEAAVSLAMRGASVTVVTPDAAPQAGRLGAEVGGRIAAWLREAGVELRTGRSVEAVDRDRGGLSLRLDDGEVRCHRVVMAVGARPRTGLARDAGVPLEDGAVPVDGAMRTAVDGIWCAGDPALAENGAAGRRLRVEHWGDALRQGAVAGRRLAGHDASWDEVPGFWSSIGHRTIKQAAWGDGWDEVAVDADAGGFTAWYGRDGAIVGVLTHERDLDYEAGRRMVRACAPWPFAGAPSGVSASPSMRASRES
jgi:NADPH-dependent 2,4-dienoyl-CoA reductase/sulfur reductase-like enzyme